MGSTVDKVPVGAVYHFSLRLKETGGHSGATIPSVLFTTPTGVAAFTATYTPATAQRVPAWGSLDLGPISITDQAGPSTSLAAEALLAVRFVDDGGHEGSAAGTASVTRTPTYSVNGVVTDGTSGPSGRMRGVLGTTLSMTMFFPSGGSDQTPACSATLTSTASSVSTDTIRVAYSGVDSCEPPANGGTLVMTRSR
jgi:hypothetical protein